MKKNRLIYGGIVLLLITFILLRESPATYVAFYAALILPAVSAFLAWLSRDKIVIFEELSQTLIAKNETTEYRLKIENQSIFPCFFIGIQLNFEAIGLSAIHNDKYLTLNPLASEEIAVAIQGKYRGVYEDFIKEMVVYDFLGLFKFRSHYEPGTKLIIMPQVIEMPELMSEMTQSGETTIKRHMQGTDYMTSAELRAFLPTDSYKQIHWKATAKRNELISKNPQEIEQTTAAFLVHNIRQTNRSLERILATEDKIMDVLVSVMSYTHGLGNRISLWAHPDETYELTTDFTKLYHEATMLSFVEIGDVHQLLNQAFKHNDQRENVYLFTQIVNKEVLDLLQKYKLLGSEIIVFLFGTTTIGNMRKLESEGIRCIRFD